jgi:multidrug resistance efflux pump
LEAILAIDQTDIEYVREGDSVEIYLEALPGREFRSQVRRISRAEMRVSPRSLSSKSGGQLVTKTDATGRERPLSTTYQVSTPLDDNDRQIPIGATGRAKIQVGHQTVAQRLWRYLSHTFNFAM